MAKKRKQGKRRVKRVGRNRKKKRRGSGSRLEEMRRQKIYREEGWLDAEDHDMFAEMIHFPYITVLSHELV